MIEKFKHVPEAWTSYGCFLYSTGRLEDGRSLLQQSEKYLDKQQRMCKHYCEDLFTVSWREQNDFTDIHNFFML